MDTTGNTERSLEAKSDIASQTVVVATKEQVFCDLAGEVAILNLKNGVYYGLNPTGARIWNIIQEPKSAQEVRDIIVNEYQVEPEQCEQDLFKLLGELATEGLIEVRGEVTPPPSPTLAG